MSSIQPNFLQRVVGRIQELWSGYTNDIFARVRSVVKRWRSSYTMPTNDWSRPNYQFWEYAYRGRVKGLGLSGLLIKPVVSKIASWSLGRAPLWKVEGKATQKALTDWWTTHHSEILSAWEGALKQGDAFLVINSDLTITLLAPDCVDPIVDEADFSKVVGWRVTQVLTHPETLQRMTIMDEYHSDRRLHRVEVNGMLREQTVYPNLIDRLPIVHIANVPSAGETFGHPETEGLIELLYKYGEVLDAAIEGNVLQGRPTPVLTFETAQDLEKFDEENASFETRTLANGDSERVKTYEVDLSQLLVASGAMFKYEAPGSFSADTVAILQILFYLSLEHQELPEFILGNAIASSKASTETQMPVFIEFVKARRGKMTGWLTEIATIALAYMALMMTRVRVQEPTLQWEPLDQEDGSLTLDTVKWAFGAGLLTELTALQLMPVEVEDPEGELARVKVERAARATLVQSSDGQIDDNGVGEGGQDEAA